MHLVGAVDARAAGRQVGAAREFDEPPRGRHVVLGQPLRGEHRLGRRVDPDPGQLQGVALAASRVRVLAIDERRDRRSAVADDARGHPLGTGDEPPADDEQAMVATGDLALDDGLPAPARGDRPTERRSGAIVVDDVERHASSVMTVHGLDHDGIAQGSSVGERVRDGGREPPAGDRQARSLQGCGGLVLVARHLGPDQARLGRHGGPDPARTDAPAELDQVALVEPGPGDVPAMGNIDDRLGGRAQSPAFGQCPERFDHAVSGVGGRAVGIDQVVGQVHRGRTGRSSDRLVLEAEDDVVDAAGASCSGLSAGRAATRCALQFQGDMLYDVAHPRALHQPVREPAGPAGRTGVAAQPRQGRHEPFAEAGHQVGGQVLQGSEIDPQVDDRQSRPTVRPVQDPGPKQANRALGVRQASPGQEPTVPDVPGCRQMDTPESSAAGPSGVGASARRACPIRKSVGGQRPTKIARRSGRPLSASSPPRGTNHSMTESSIEPSDAR